MRYNFYMKICSLNLVSSYSFYKSIVKIKEFCKLAKQYGYECVGINDFNLYAYPEFKKECKANGLNPIFLKSFKLKIENYYRLLDCSFCILNEQGYSTILELYRIQKEELTIDDLLEFNKGLALIITLNEDFTFDEFQKKISPILLKFKKQFNNNLYFGISIKSKEDESMIKDIYTFIDNNGYKLIPFPSIKYLYKGDYGLYKILLDSKSVEKNNSLQLDDKGPDFLLKTDVYQSLYRKEDFSNLEELIQCCDFTFCIKRGTLIEFDNADQKLKDLCLTNLNNLNLSEDKRYIERLQFELKTIKEMGFSSYFLLVSDYVDYAKKNNIKVGYGRGSAVGSLVSYLLKITYLDPIYFSLSFERFLNPMRKTMPDIDIDFEDERREEIISYLVKKYGEDKVAKIVTFSKLRPKSSINLIGKAINISEKKIKAITSSISDSCKTFEEAKTDKRNGNKFLQFYNDPLNKQLIDKAERLLAIPIQTSIHASGVIVSKDSLYKSIPLSDKMTGIALYEFPYLEEMGFLKVDILSLANLTFLKRIEESIEDNSFSSKRVLANLDDEKVYKTLNDLSLSNIFQFDDNSSGIKNAIEEIHPNNFKELCAIMALYRPGAMKYISLYSQRKKGLKKVEYIHPSLESILKETYGIMIYQEQVMEVVKVIANFSLAEADIFRRAISKKNIKLMDEYKEKFITQAIKNNVEKNIGEKIFDDIVQFASYGFNKSHAYAYSFLTYMFLYLKTYYPLNFYQISIEKDSLNSVKGQNLYLELKEKYKKIRIDINKSSYDKLVLEDDMLFLPLNMVRETDEDILKEIIRLKENQPYIDFKDVIRRLSPSIYDHKDEEKKIGRTSKTIKSLIEAGAFDSFNIYRATLLNSVDNSILSARFLKLFDEQIIDEKIENVGEKLSKEKDKLGVVISCNLKKSENERYLYVEDVIYLSNNKIRLVLSDGIKEYNLIRDEEIKIERFDFFIIKADFNYKILRPSSTKYIGKELRNEENIHS